jgi:hypothetical protein
LRGSTGRISECTRWANRGTDRTQTTLAMKRPEGEARSGDVVVVCEDDATERWSVVVLQYPGEAPETIVPSRWASMTRVEANAFIRDLKVNTGGRSTAWVWNGPKTRLLLLDSQRV